MTNDVRVPVAIRITRPYGSEEEFLKNELDTLTRTTVVLVGAQSRPQGVVLRFEVTLASGDPLLRGEGRVVAFKAASAGTDAGLTLRFTRLDARSKALIDRAANMREARARASLHPRSMPPGEPAASAPAAAPEPPPLPRELRQEPKAPTAPPPPVARAASASPPPPVARAASASPPPPVVARRPSAPAPPVAPPPPPPTSSKVVLTGDTQVGTAWNAARASGPSLTPGNREELLDRLRQRAKALSPSAVESILAARARRA